MEDIGYQITNVVLMQPLQCDSRPSGAKDNTMGAAAAAKDVDAAHCDLQKLSCKTQ